MLRGLVLEEVILSGANRDLHSGLFGGAGGQSDPCAGEHPRRSARRQRRGDAAGLLRRRRGTARGHRRAMARSRLRRGEVSWRRRPSRVRPARPGAACWSMMWSRPTCDVNGIVGGYTGEGTKTVLPAEASAKVSFRLVGAQNPDEDPRKASAPSCKRAAAGRREGGVYLAWRRPGAQSALRVRGADARPPGAGGGMGQSSRR